MIGTLNVCRVALLTNCVQAMTTENELSDARTKRRPTNLRWLAWSGAAFGAAMILLGWLMAPAEGSNYAVVLIDQAARIELGMWVSAAVGIVVPAVVWLAGFVVRPPRHNNDAGASKPANDLSPCQGQTPVQ